MPRGAEAQVIIESIVHSDLVTFVVRTGAKV